MLEYLLSFIQNNIIIIFICILGSAIASAFSKKMKILFGGILLGAIIYFALLCLHRFGVGVEYLYIESCKIMITLCEWFEHSKSILIRDDFIFRFIGRIFNYPSLQKIFYEVTTFMILFMCILCAIDKSTKVFESFNFKNIEINTIYIIKKEYFINTIKEQQPKFILNSCFRC